MLNGFTRTELAKLMWEKPYFAQVELTRNCNYKCIFCFENCNSEKKYEDKSFEEWKKVIDGLKLIGVKQIHFSGRRKFFIQRFY